MKRRLPHLISRFLSALLLAALLLAIVRVTPAFAAPGDCDGTASDDNITCSANPTNPDQSIQLDDGNDNLVVNAGVSTGFIEAGLGDDHITINGSVSITVGGLPPYVEGNQGNDTIIVNGFVSHNVFGNEGEDTITINGEASSAVGGDDNDVIIVNGKVVQLFGGGGDDYIELNGTAQALNADDGNDQVVLGANAIMNNTISGGAGTDTLSFKGLTQAQANALNPAGDTTTVNGHTYTWLNFENLIGLLEELAERGLRVFFASNSLVAVESNDGDGISFFAEHGRIAFVSYESLDDLDAGESASYKTPNSAGWYVTVTCFGADSEHPRHTLYQVNIFAAGGSSAGQFTFSN